MLTDDPDEADVDEPEDEDEEEAKNVTGSESESTDYDSMIISPPAPDVVSPPVARKLIPATKSK